MRQSVLEDMVSVEKAPAEVTTVTFAVEPVGAASATADTGNQEATFTISDGQSGNT